MIPANLCRFEPPSCVSCRTFVPEAMVPVGDETLPMCWLCAHHVTTHEGEVGTSVTDCSCSAHEIYPPDVLRRRGAVTAELGAPPVDDRSQKPADYIERPIFVGRDSKRTQAMRDARRERNAAAGGPKSMSMRAVTE